MSIYIPIISDVIGLGKTWIEGKQKTALAKQEAKNQLITAEANAKARRLEKAAESETSYDLEALRQTQFSWKDEYLTVFVTVLIILHFIPFTQPFMAAGWVALAQAPEWFAWVAAPGVFVAGLGLRWMYQKRFK